MVADSGDFFEGVATRAQYTHLEKLLLRTLYDLVSPGNHGYEQYSMEYLRDKTVCANVHHLDTPLFADVLVQRVASLRVAITGLIGNSAFHSIPQSHRDSHEVLDPAEALTRVLQQSAFRGHSRSVKVGQSSSVFLGLIPSLLTKSNLASSGASLRYVSAISFRMGSSRPSSRNTLSTTSG